MEKSINDKIKALQSDTSSHEEFMKKLAEVDENGQLTDDLLDQVNGGGATIKVSLSPLISIPTWGMWLPTTPVLQTNG